MTFNNIPVLLTDKCRLQEIYDLRVIAYEHSQFREFVNHKLYPKGWADFLDNDDKSFHWVVEVNNKIIASARLTILYDFHDFEKLGNHVLENLIPPERPLGFFSRLVVKKEYRGNGIGRQLDLIRIKKLRDLNLPVGFVDCRDDRLTSLIEVGFSKIGVVNVTENGKPEILHFLIIK